MRLTSVRVANCKSFREPETVRFNRTFTVLIGPNGGGKSNTLDIVNIVLRRLFLHSYVEARGSDRGTPWCDLNRQNTFTPIAEYLDRNDAADPALATEIHFTVEVGEGDITNMEAVCRHRVALEAKLETYRNKPFQDLAFVQDWDSGLFQDQNTLEYSIVNGALSGTLGGAEKAFQTYLNHIQALMILGSAIDGFDLRPPVTYFSPYRNAAPADLQAVLSNERYFDLLHQYVNATSKTPTSLIKLASVFFAEKRRAAELQYARHDKAWSRDPDVMLVSGYLNSVGYAWTMDVVDRNENRYEVRLTADGREFGISKASSGEKEILNFLLGISALRSRGGMILIDEPELHLHPRWQVVLRDLLSEMAE